MSDQWAVNLGLQFGLAESESNDPTFGAVRANSAINELHFGTDFILMSHPFELIPEIQIAYPLEKYDVTTDDVMTSEGALQATAAIRLQYNSGSFLTFGKLGYTYRAEGRSSLLPYSIAAAYDTGHTLFGLDISGFESITSDLDGKAPLTRVTAVNRVEAGANRFFSIDPSATDAALFLNMDITPRWSLDLNGGYIFAGANYPQGIHAGATITINWDLYPSNQSHRPSPIEMSAPVSESSKLSTEKEINSFEEQVQDGVDQNLFKARPTEKPKPPPIQQPKPNIKPVKPPVWMKRGTPAKSGKRKINKKSLQEELDETEMQIKLRRQRR